MSKKYGLLDKLGYEMAAENLPTFLALKEYLKNNPSGIVDGCNPSQILSELLDLAAIYTLGMDGKDAMNDIESLLR